MRSPGVVFCRICGAYLARDDEVSRGGICGSQLCKQLDSQFEVIVQANKNAIEEEKRRCEMVEVVRRRSIALRANLNHGPLLRIVVLPFLEHNLEPPSEERRGRVEAGFLELASNAYALNSEETRFIPADPPQMKSEEHTNLNSELDESEQRFSRLNASACGLCSGRCCNLGGDEAFLPIDKFREVLRSRPELSPDEIVKEYMDRIPVETFVDSCIFHGIKGCGLSREQRSISCNVYECSSLRDLRDGIDENPSAFLLASTNFREVNGSEQKVYRMSLSTDTSEECLLKSPSDRSF